MIDLQTHVRPKIDPQILAHHESLSPVSARFLELAVDEPEGWEPVDLRGHPRVPEFFHTYPLSDDEQLEHIVGSVTFAAHFFPSAARHLRDNGVFTYMSNEIDSLSRGHQRLLFQHFSEVTTRVLKPLRVPEEVRDAWWADSMVLVKATR